MSKCSSETGRRLLPSLVDHWAALDPKRTFCTLPNGLMPEDGFHRVTFTEIANSADFMSGWIETTIGRGTNETLVYLGTNDIRYIIVFLACNKMGYKLFLPSSRNSEEAFVHLLQKTNSTVFLYTPEFEGRVQSLRVHHSPMKLFEVPSWNYMSTRETSHYPYTKSFESEENRVALILHTSGTTGLPKPIFLTHGYFAAFDNLQNFPLPPSRSLAFPSRSFFEAGSILTVTPFFHMMGFGIFLQAIFFGIPFSVPPPKPLSGRLVIDTMEALKTRAAILPPSLIENICGTTEGQESLCRLNCLCFGGAPLAPNTGEILRDRVTLLSVIGSTEMGVLLSMTPEKSEEWSYFDWAPNFNIAMDPVGDDLCELVIQRGKNRNFHGIFHTFPDLVEYRSNDLFRQHPTKGNLWQYAGRLDDIIVLSNGEKFNPVTMEKLIEAHPLVSRAVVVGEGQFQSALLIEPNWDLWNPNVLSSMDDFVDALWPHVQVANNAVPAYGHVMKDRIRIASRCKPFKTTPKGSTQRRRVNEDYKEEIQTLYTNQHSVSLEFPETPYLHSVTDFIRRAVHNQFCQREIGDLDDFYLAGFDSLQTVALANTLDNAIRSKYPGPAGDKFVTVQTIYGHSSIKNLSSFITGLLRGTQDQADSSRYHRIATTVETLTNNLPKRRQPVIPRGAREGSVILLTGSTGSLGSYILDSLLGVSSVRKIYCLNRTRDAESRQKMSHQEKGLKLWPLNNGRVEFVHACFTEDHLGLSIATYSKLLEEVDIIIHNAWKVDFNQSLASFQPMIKSVRALVDFGSQSKYCPHLFFVSSISTIAGWKPSMGDSSAPEGPILSPDAALKQGYAESKHVAERLCYEASKTVGIPTTVLRVGQVAGPTYAMGKWNPREWLPALIMSSTSLGKVPRTLGSANEINWIPVNNLAEIIWDIVRYRLSQQQEVASATFHLVNPHTTQWQSLRGVIEKQLNLETVELSEWIGNLTRTTKVTECTVQENPALKLLDFFSGLSDSTEQVCSIDVSKAMDASEILASLMPISMDLMENWLRQWGLTS